MSTIVNCCAWCTNAFANDFTAWLEVLWQWCSVFLLENIGFLKVRSKVLLAPRGVSLLRVKNSTIDRFLKFFGDETCSLTIIRWTRRLLTSPQVRLSLDESSICRLLRRYWRWSVRDCIWNLLLVRSTLNVIHQLISFCLRKHNLLRLLTKLESTFRWVLGAQGLVLTLEVIFS